jgi:hypothetical protein
LDPVVSLEEEAEYQGYIDQCQYMLEEPIRGEYDEDFDEDGISRLDGDIYKLAVRTALGHIPETKNEARDAFTAYVDRASSWNNEPPLTGREGYEKWLTVAMD